MLEWSSGDEEGPDTSHGPEALDWIRDSIDNALIRSRDVHHGMPGKGKITGLQKWNVGMYSKFKHIEQ